MGASEVVNLKRQEIFLSILEWTTIIPGLIEIYVYSYSIRFVSILINNLTKQIIDMPLHCQKLDPESVD